MKLSTATIGVFLLSLLLSSPALPADATDADRAFVEKVLQTVTEDDPSTAATAELVLFNAGAKYVPAIKEARAKAAGLARRTVDSALVRLEWKLDPAALIRKSVGEVPDNIKEQMNPVLVSDDSTARAFPEFRFYVVGFMQHPIAVDVPEPLKERNIFILSRDGKVQLVNDTGDLTAFFAKSLAPVKDEKAARDAGVAWLELSKELAQDGMYRWKLPIDEVKAVALDANWVVTGRVMVEGKGGNTGGIGVTMTFGPNGKANQIKQIENLKPGIRPMCQSTKLLDPDPIVRRMAEGDLLVMGTMARDYIFSQRAKASPTLQKEIDRVWKLILERERAPEIPKP